MNEPGSGTELSDEDVEFAQLESDLRLWIGRYPKAETAASHLQLLPRYGIVQDHLAGRHRGQLVRALIACFNTVLPRQKCQLSRGEREITALRHLCRLGENELDIKAETRRDDANHALGDDAALSGAAFAKSKEPALRRKLAGLLWELEHPEPGPTTVTHSTPLPRNETTPGRVLPATTTVDGADTDPDAAIESSVDDFQIESLLADVPPECSRALDAEAERLGTSKRWWQEGSAQWYGEFFAFWCKSGVTIPCDRVQLRNTGE